MSRSRVVHLAAIPPAFLPGASLRGEDFSDPRISAGLLLAAPDCGGSDLTAESAARFPFSDVDFSGLKTRTPIVCGDEDVPKFTPRGPDRFADAFHNAPGAEALPTLHGVGHGLDGIVGLEARVTDTEAPDTSEATKRLSLAWPRPALTVGAEVWTAAGQTLAERASGLARLRASKRRDSGRPASGAEEH